MTEYECKYCQRTFSRGWNRDRHVKDIHERYRDKGYNPRILERNNSYQKEPTNHTGVYDVWNILGNSDYGHQIGSNSEAEPDVDSRGEEKMELPWLIFKILPKYKMLRSFFKDPNCRQAIFYSGYWWRRCILEKSSKPLDDIVRRHMRRFGFRL